MRWTMAAGALAAMALVLFAVLDTPRFFDSGGRPWAGLAAVAAILAAYGAAGRVGIAAARRAGVLRVAGPAGLAAGGIYGAEVLLEYLVRPADNTAWGLAEFGGVFALMALAGGLIAMRTRRLRPALAGGAWTGMIGALIWYVVVLAAFCALRGSAAQDAVFRAEGNYEDFARSGLRDFQVFVVQDVLGAGFFHLLLSPIFGVMLGALGGGVGLLIPRRGAD